LIHTFQLFDVNEKSKGLTFDDLTGSTGPAEGHTKWRLFYAGQDNRESVQPQKLRDCCQHCCAVHRTRGSKQAYDAGGSKGTEALYNQSRGFFPP